MASGLLASIPIAAAYSGGFHEQAHSSHDLARTAQHQGMVAGEVRLAFGTVDYKYLGMRAGRWRELDLGRKSGSAESYYAGVVYYGDDFGWGERVDFVIGPTVVAFGCAGRRVSRRVGLVSLYGHCVGRISSCALDLFDLRYRARYWAWMFALTAPAPRAMSCPRVT